MGACMSKEYWVIMPTPVRVMAENEREAKEKAAAEIQYWPENLIAYETEYQ